MVKADFHAVVITPYAQLRHGLLYRAAFTLGARVTMVTPSVPVDDEWPSTVPRVTAAYSGSGHTRQWIHGIEGLVADLRPDIVHVHNEPWAVTTQRAIRLGPPIVVHGVENLYRAAPVRYRVRRAGTRHALRSVAGYANWGSTGLWAAREAGLPASTPQAVISAGPADPAVFRRSPAPAFEENLRCVFVGRLVAQKGVATIIEAIAADRGRVGRMSLDVVGEGPEAGSLRRLAERRGVRATFHGRLDAHQTHSVMSSGHAVVVPSITTRTWSEQWGRSAVEAMMTGRPVLVSDSGELPHLVPDPSWVFPQRDPTALGEALDTLYEDPIQLGIRGDLAFQRSIRFQPEQLARDLIQLWERVLTRA